MTCLHHIAILVSDKAKAIAFYGALGFSVERAYPRPDRGDEIVWMAGNGLTLELFVAPDRPARLSGPEAYGLRHIALVTPRVAKIHKALLAAGYRPEPLRADSLTGEVMFFIKDPDGLPIEIRKG